MAWDTRSANHPQWANTTQTNIKKLQGIQNSAARIVCNIRKYDHVSPALRNLKWIPVKSQLYLRDAIKKTVPKWRNAYIVSARTETF